MQLVGSPHLFAFLFQGMQPLSGRLGAVSSPCSSVQSYYTPSYFRSSPLEWPVNEGTTHDRLCTGQAPRTILGASLSSGTGHVEALQKRCPSPFTRISTGSGMSTHRLLRTRRRNIRFLCSSRKNRMRGLLPPAKATLEEEGEKYNSAEEALLLRSMQLKDPLVDEVPVRRWRTQWYDLTCFLFIFMHRRSWLRYTGTCACLPLSRLQWSDFTQLLLYSSNQVPFLRQAVAGPPDASSLKMRCHC